MGAIDRFRTRLMEAQAIGRMAPAVARSFLVSGSKKEIKIWQFDAKERGRRDFP